MVGLSPPEARVNAEYLLKRRAAVVARHETLESVPGSGYHPDDEPARAEARKGMAPPSRRPVALQHDGRVWLCGPDVPAVRAALAAFVAAFRAEWEGHRAAAEAAGVEPSVPAAMAKQAEAVAARVAKEAADVIELPTNEFNAVLYGLRDRGVHVVAAGVLP